MTNEENFIHRMVTADYVKTRRGSAGVAELDLSEGMALRDQVATLPRAIPTVDQLVEMVRGGLPARSFRFLCDAIGVSAERLARVAHIAPRTLARRRIFKPDESDRILRLGRLFQQATAVLGGEEEARRWLLAPQWALGGAVPLDYADTEPGAREVEALLGRMEHGVVA